MRNIFLFRIFFALLKYVNMYVNGLHTQNYAIILKANPFKIEFALKTNVFCI